MPYVIRRLDLSALPSSPSRAGALPDFPVVYIIHNETEVFYVGATKSLFNRWGAHCRSWQLEKIVKRKDVRVTWIRANVEQFADFELALIQFLKPKINSIRKGRVYHHGDHGAHKRKGIRYVRLAS